MALISRSEDPSRVSSSPDNVTLRIARGDDALPVMRVVIGGVASRHNLPLDQLDDVQLAVETLMAEEPTEGGLLALSLSMAPDGLSVRLDGLTNRSLHADLMAAAPFQPSLGCLLDARLFLHSLVDSYQVVEGEAGTFAVEMKKQIA